MTSKLVPELKSKEACPRCEKHKLFTNDSEKEDSVIHYHCLACNFEYNETSDSKAYKKRKAKEKKKDEPSSFLGLAIFVLMMFVILTVTVDQERKRDAVQPLNSTELVP